MIKKIPEQRHKKYTRKDCYDTGMALAVVAVIAGLLTHKTLFHYLTLGIIVIKSYCSCLVLSPDCDLAWYVQVLGGMLYQK